MQQLFIITKVKYIKAINQTIDCLFKYFKFECEIMTNASDNAAIEKTYAEKQQIQVNTMLDGQIRELDKPFEVAGRKAMYPSGFAEDIHCRCALLQRARLDDS